MNSNIDKEIKDKLASKHVCYVLITCDEPAEDGHMSVEMAYDGDPVLAAYLLQGAQAYFEENDIERNHTEN